MAATKRESIPLFPERLEELRGDMTYEEFGALCGISKQSVGLYLRGKRIPDAATLRDIAYANDVSSDWLLGLSDTRTTDRDMKSACNVTHLDEEFIFRLKQWREAMPEITRHFFNILSSLPSFFPMIEELLNLYISVWNDTLNPSNAQNSNEASKVPMLFRQSPEKYEPDVKVSFLDVIKARVQQYANHLVEEADYVAEREADLAHYAFSDFAGFDISGFLNGNYRDLYDIFDNDFFLQKRPLSHTEYHRFEDFVAKNYISPETKKQIEREFNIIDLWQRGNKATRNYQSQEKEVK